MVLIRLDSQIKITFTEDTMETASHFICKDCLQTQYDALESPHLKGEGRR